MAKRNQFTFYRSFYDAMKNLEPGERLELLEAVMAFALDGVEPGNLGKCPEVAFTLIRPTLEASAQKSRMGMNSAASRAAKKKLNENKNNNENENNNENKKENENEYEVENKVENEKEVEVEIEDECLAGEGFTAFWKKYPLKLGKEKAMAVWIASVEDPAAVLKGLDKWLWSNQWQRENGRFVPRADKFLEDGYYKEDPPGEVPKGGTGELGKAELEAIAAVMAGTVGS